MMYKGESIIEPISRSQIYESYVTVLYRVSLPDLFQRKKEEKLCQPCIRARLP